MSEFPKRIAESTEKSETQRSMEREQLHAKLKEKQEAESARRPKEQLKREGSKSHESPSNKKPRDPISKSDDSSDETPMKLLEQVKQFADKGLRKLKVLNIEDFVNIVVDGGLIKDTDAATKQALKQLLEKANNGEAEEVVEIEAEGGEGEEEEAEACRSPEEKVTSLGKRVAHSKETGLPTEEVIKGLGRDDGFSEDVFQLLNVEVTKTQDPSTVLHNVLQALQFQVREEDLKLEEVKHMLQKSGSKRIAFRARGTVLHELNAFILDEHFDEKLSIRNTEIWDDSDSKSVFIGRNMSQRAVLRVALLRELSIKLAIYGSRTSYSAEKLTLTDAAGNRAYTIHELQVLFPRDFDEVVKEKFTCQGRNVIKTLLGGRNHQN